MVLFTIVLKIYHLQYHLNEATKPFIARLASNGIEGLKSNNNLLMALNTHDGYLVNKEVADAHDLEYSDPSSIL